MTTSAEDVRIGRLLRAVRRRARLTQALLATQAGVPILDIRLIEHGRVGDVRFDRTRRLFALAGGRVRLTAWWNGAAADRLLDERHAVLVERVVQLLRRRGWDVRVEVSFSEFGERGSIDVLAAQRERRAVGAFEVKTDLGSLEEINRVLDAKERLAPKLSFAQFGWRPAVVGRVLVVPRDMTIRRIIDRHGETMAAVYPCRSREVRTWLRQPDRNVRGIWFVSDTPM